MREIAMLTDRQEVANLVHFHPLSPSLRRFDRGFRPPTYIVYTYQVAETEPKTLYWVALRLDENNFAIFDIFADETGREAHFAGQVAGLLKEQSSTLVAGGWEEGVVANVRNYKILAIK